jgi:ATP-dependent DNA helicase RecQ
VSWCGGRFGVSRIVEIVRGSKSKVLIAYGAEGCPTYGSCRSRSKVSVTRLLKDLIDAGYLHVEGLEYPTLNVTRSGQEVVQGANSAVLKKSEGRVSEPAAVKPTHERRKSVTIVKAAPADPHLFERLRRLRTDLAEEEGVAPFVIFHDKTLRRIADQKPATTASLLEIPGIGEVKVERYGRRVLEIVNGDQ